MTDLVMLICASVGSLAFGILAAYGILRMAFALMHPQSRPVVVKAHQEAARVQ
jgi:ABC-type glycerol-3-phosphate transport system permease component